MTQYLAGTKGGAVSATLSTANVPLAAYVHPVSGTASGSVTINGTTAPATQAGPSTGKVLATANYVPDASDPTTNVPVNIYGPAAAVPQLPSAPAPSRCPA